MSTSAGRVLIIPKGEYNASTTYSMLDLVTYQGSSYVCKQTSTGNLPTNTTYWQLSAQGNGSGGHTIKDSTGTSMTQREGLQFDGGLTVSDDSTNDKTIVSASGLLSKTGDSKDNTVTYTSADDASVFNSGNLGGQSAYAWNAVNVMATGEKHSVLFNKISTMFKNIRTIAKLIGTTDISSIGSGTITGAISGMSGDISNIGAKIPIGTALLQPNLAGGSASGLNIDNVGVVGGVPIGMVWCHTTDISGTYPMESGVDAYFFLLSLMSNANEVVQLAMPYNYTYKMAIRLFVNNTWTTWQAIS